MNETIFFFDFLQTKPQRSIFFFLESEIMNHNTPVCVFLTVSSLGGCVLVEGSLRCLGRMFANSVAFGPCNALCVYLDVSRGKASGTVGQGVVWQAWDSSCTYKRTLRTVRCGAGVWESSHPRCCAHAFAEQAWGFVVRGLRFTWPAWGIVFPAAWPGIVLRGRRGELELCTAGGTLRCLGPVREITCVCVS